MYRISNEGGDDARARSYGRLALAIIPAALGGAALLWIAAASGCIDLSSKITVHDRAMRGVNITTIPKDPIRLVAHDGRCLKIEQPSTDGYVVTFYARNSCDHDLKMPNYEIKVRAGDGTVLKGEKWAFNDEKSIPAHERREQIDCIEQSDRTEQIDVYAWD